MNCRCREAETLSGRTVVVDRTLLPNGNFKEITSSVNDDPEKTITCTDEKSDGHKDVGIKTHRRGEGWNGSEDKITNVKRS